MKTRFLVVLVVLGGLFFSLTSFTPNNTLGNKTALQDTTVITADYDGNEDYGYNFLYVDEDDIEKTITFKEVAKDVLLMFNLNSDELVGKSFEITYIIKLDEYENDEGETEEEEIFFITQLKQL